MPSTSPAPYYNNNNNSANNNISTSSSNNNNRYNNEVSPTPSSGPVLVSTREQLVALRRNLPTHAELLRVCEQFPEEGDRLSAYVQQVEQRINDLENQRREEHRSAQRHRHEIAMQTAKELERQKMLETEDKFRARETAVERNKREARRERARQRHEKMLLEAENMEAFRRFKKRREIEIKEDAESRLEHWYEQIEHAEQQREKHRESMRQRIEAEQKEWKKRVEESRVKKDQRLRSRTEEVEERNSRLSHMAQHKHDLAVQARLRQETGKEEKTQIVRAAVRRNEASKMAEILNSIEESETRHEQIVHEQKDRRSEVFRQLKKKREEKMKLARDRVRQMEEEREDKLHDFAEKQEKDQRRHLSHHREVRQMIAKRIHETNEKRHRAHHVVKENRDAELEEAARKILSRTAKVGATVGVDLQPAGGGPGVGGLLDEEMSRARESNTFRLNMNTTNSRQRRRYVDTARDDDDDDQPGVNKNDPRSKPAILRMGNYSPKVVTKKIGGDESSLNDATNNNNETHNNNTFSSLELILETKPKNKRGKSLQLLAKAKKEHEEKQSKQREEFQKEEEQKRKAAEEDEGKERTTLQKDSQKQLKDLVDKRKKKLEQEKEEQRLEKEKEEQEELAKKKAKEQADEKEKQDNKSINAKVEPKEQAKQEEKKEDTNNDEKKTTDDSSNKKENNDSSKQPTSSRHVTPQAVGASSSSSSSSPKFRAVIIADSDNNKIPGASADAATIIAMLQNILGSDVFNERQVLIDDDKFLGRTASPSKNAIISAFEWLVKESKPNDACLVYYFGPDPSVCTELHTDDFKQKLLLQLAAGVRCTIISNTDSGNSILGVVDDESSTLPVTWKWRDDAHRYMSMKDEREGKKLATAATTTVLRGKCDNSITNSISEVLASKVGGGNNTSSSSDDGKLHIRFGEFLTRCHDSVTKNDDKAQFHVETTFVPSSAETEFVLI